MRVVLIKEQLENYLRKQLIVLNKPSETISFFSDRETGDVHIKTFGFIKCHEGCLVASEFFPAEEVLELCNSQFKKEGYKASSILSDNSCENFVVKIKPIKKIKFLKK